MKIRDAIDKCHSASLKAGWWRPLEDLSNDLVGHMVSKDKYWRLYTTWSAHFFATKISLIHSEVSEMLEGLRRGTNDDHLPHRTTEEVEAADIAIRLFDYCGARRIDLETIIDEKLAYNAERADHKMTNRQKSGGKRF